MKNVLSFFALGLLVLALIVFLSVPQVFAPVFRPLVQANAPRSTRRPICFPSRCRI